MEYFVCNMYNVMLVEFAYEFLLVIEKAIEFTFKYVSASRPNNCLPSSVVTPPVKLAMSRFLISVILLNLIPPTVTFDQIRHSACKSITGAD